MNPKSAFETDNRGVSPVIGVILMVAITVILAAVIGTFVLNLGGDLQQTPQAQISISPSDTTGEVEISHSGGDSLQTSDLEVQKSDGTSLTPGFTNPFSVGDSVSFAPSGTSSDDEVTIQVVHTPSDSILVENTVTIP